MTRAAVLDLLSAERDRAESLRESGLLAWTSADPDCPTELWLAALVEELGEIARCIHDHESTDRLRTELIQLAGVAIGRVEALASRSNTERGRANAEGEAASSYE